MMLQDTTISYFILDVIPTCRWYSLHSLHKFQNTHERPTSIGNGRTEYTQINDRPNSRNQHQTHEIAIKRTALTTDRTCTTEQKKQRRPTRLKPRLKPKLNPTSDNGNSRAHSSTFAAKLTRIYQKDVRLPCIPRRTIEFNPIEFNPIEFNLV